MLPPDVQPTHAMILQSTAPDGVEEWLFPACGRRFLMQWPPEYKKTVLEPGDEYAVHTGGKGLPGLALEVRAGMEEPRTTPEQLEGAGDEPLPGPFQDWWEKRGK